MTVTLSPSEHDIEVLPTIKVACQLVSVTPLGADVFSVHLRLPEEQMVAYHAGQYMLLERENGQWSAFSIASAPQQGRDLELHILARDAAPVALLQQLQKDGVAQVQMPLGAVHLSGADERPLLLIAAGTGMAQVQSIIEDCRARDFRLPLHIYWGARVADDFYTLTKCSDWTAMPNVHFHQIVSEDSG